MTKQLAVVLKPLTLQSSNLVTFSFSLLGTFWPNFNKINPPGGRGPKAAF